MYFRILNNEASGELSYLLADQTGSEAVLIDPKGRDLPVLSALLSEQNLHLRWVLRTHHHDGLQPKEPDMLAALGAPLVQGDKPHDDSVLAFGDDYIDIINTPGHTRTCLSFRWLDRLFCGGLLSVTACPHQPLPADPEALWDSVTQRIFTLADETLLFFGHAQHARLVSTVLEQRRWNPYFSCQTRDEYLARIMALPDHESLIQKSSGTTR